MRSALAIQQRRILFFGIKVRRQYNPHVHVFAVFGAHGTALYLAFGDVAPRIVGHRCPFAGLAGGSIHGKQFSRCVHGRAGGHQRVARYPQTGVVVLPICNASRFIGVQLPFIQLIGKIVTADKKKRLPVGGPLRRTGLKIPSFGQFPAYIGAGIQQHDARAVGLKPGAFHAGPGQIFAIGRKHRILIVAWHALRHVQGSAAADVVEVQVRVGALRFGGLGQFPACVHNEAGIFAPGDLFYAAHRTQGTVVSFAHDVYGLANQLACVV